MKEYSNSTDVPWYEYKDTIKTVLIESGITYINDTSISFCSSLTTITVVSNNQNYKSDAGVLFNKSGTTLIKCPPKKSGSYTIPSSVTSLDYYAFFTCNDLTSITVPSSLSALGYYGFSHCEGLTSINVDTNNPYYSSIDGVFFDKRRTILKQFPAQKSGNYVIPNSVTSIQTSAFASCVKLTSITIPNSVTSIGEWAFAHCSQLTSMTIPASVTSLDSYAFWRCNSLTSLTFKGTNNPGASSTDVFSYCDKLYCLLVPTSYTSNTFCGHSVIKGTACPAPTPTASRSPMATPSRSPMATRSRSPMATPTPTPTTKFTAPLDYFQRNLTANIISVCRMLYHALELE